MFIYKVVKGPLSGLIKDYWIKLCTVVGSFSNLIEDYLYAQYSIYQVVFRIKDYCISGCVYRALYLVKVKHTVGQLM